jgi:2-dehydro-3-deoxy-D-gluconate 5-dehydrogenase
VAFEAPSFDLTGRVAVVTGGNRGIGRSIALGLASAGASVAILARDGDRNAAVEEEIEELSRRAYADTLDVTDRAALGPALEHVEAALGPIDILVNNAGTVDIAGGILSQSEERWDAALAIHLTATMLLSKIAASSMKERGRGKIVNLASMYSIFGAGALPSYGAAKGGIVQLTRAMAVDLAPFGIQVNAIAPGWITTEMTAVVRRDDAWSDMHATLMACTPAGRWGNPDDCAGAAVFLASDAARFVTGVMLPVDGGYSVS